MTPPTGRPVGRPRKPADPDLVRILKDCRDNGRPYVSDIEEDQLSDFKILDRELRRAAREIGVGVHIRCVDLQVSVSVFDQDRP